MVLGERCGRARQACASDSNLCSGVEWSRNHAHGARESVGKRSGRAHRARSRMQELTTPRFEPCESRPRACELAHELCELVRELCRRLHELGEGHHERCTRAHEVDQRSHELDEGVRELHERACKLHERSCKLGDRSWVRDVGSQRSGARTRAAPSPARVRKERSRNSASSTRRAWTRSCSNTRSSSRARRGP